MNEKDKRAVEHFQAILRIKTVSGKEEYRGEFERFLPTLRELYPGAFAAVETEIVGDFGILIRWPGKKSGKKPVVLMAHQDVVDCEAEKWTYPPFAAEIHDGAVWARGSVDTKCIIGALLEAAESLISEGFQPERDIYLAFGSDEEIFGGTMPRIVDALRKRGVYPWFVLDEGGAVLSEMPMGIKECFAMVAVAEKAYGTLRVKMQGKGNETALTRVAAAAAKIGKKPLPGKLTPALAEMLRALAPYTKPALRIVLKNIGLFAPAVKKVMESNSDTETMVRSRMVLDEIKNDKKNKSAEASFTLRLNPGDSFESVLAHVKTIVDEDAELSCEVKSAPVSVTPTNTAAFRHIESTVKKVFGAHTAPFLLNGGTDGRHFKTICSEVYRFGAFRMSTAMRESVHGENERMPIINYLEGIRFYRAFIENLN